MDRKPGHCRVLWLVALLASPGVVAAKEYHRPVVRQGERFEHVGAKARLEQIVQAVEESNVPHLVGLARWRSQLAARRAAIEQASTHEQFARTVDRLLKSTGVSHFGYYADQDWVYWFLRGTFWSDNPDVCVDHVGLYPERIDGRWFIRGVLEGSPAGSTMIRVGDEVLSVDGVPYSPIASFRGKTGRPTSMRLRRKPGLIYNLIVTPVNGPLSRTVQTAIRESIRVIEHDGFNMAYMHGWTLLGRGTEYRQLAEIQDDVDGLLLDYRDGYGGRWHAAERFLLGRDHGPRELRGHAQWTKPVVILIDDGTRSAKEIVVDAVREARRAPLVGAPTPGSVTSVGAVRLIGPDGLLMLPGHRFSLEGNPTEPDYLVRRDIRYCAGSDPQLRKAKRVLALLIRESHRHPASAKATRRRAAA